MLNEWHEHQIRMGSYTHTRTYKVTHRSASEKERAIRETMHRKLSSTEIQLNLKCFTNCEEHIKH